MGVTSAAGLWLSCMMAALVLQVGAIKGPRKCFLLKNPVVPRDPRIEVPLNSSDYTAAIWRECHVQVPDSDHPLTLTLSQAIQTEEETTEVKVPEEKILEVPVDIYPKSYDFIWGLTFTLRSPNMTRLATLRLHHDPGYVFTIDRLYVSCGSGKGDTDSYTVLRRQYHYCEQVEQFASYNQTSSKYHVRSIISLKIQVGSGWARVVEADPGPDNIVAASINCSAITAAHLPHVTLDVACEGKSSRCASISSVCTRKCQSVVLPRYTHTLQLSRTTAGQEDMVGTQILLHPPANITWDLKVDLRVLNSTTIAARVQILHYKGVDRLFVRCGADDKGNVTLVSPWLPAAAQLTSPLTVTFQVGRQWVQVTKLTQGQEGESHHHKCPAPFDDYLHLRLWVRCDTPQGCGSLVQSCHGECGNSAVSLPSPNHPLSLSSTRVKEEVVLETTLSLQPQLDSIWWLSLSLQPQESITWGTRVNIRHYGHGHGKLNVVCDGEKEYTSVNFTWSLTAYFRPHLLTLQVGRTWVKVQETTAGQHHNMIDVHHTCSHALLHFPHLSLGVECKPIFGGGDCPVLTESCGAGDPVWNVSQPTGGRSVVVVMVMALVAVLVGGDVAWL